MTGCLCGWFFNWILSPELELHRYVYYHLPTLLYLFMLNHKEHPEYLSGIDVLLLAIYNHIRKSISSKEKSVKIPDLSQPSIYQVNELKEESDEMTEKDSKIIELSRLEEISDINFYNINLVFTITLYYLKREIFILPNTAICKLCGLFLVYILLFIYSFILLFIINRLTCQPFVSQFNINANSNNNNNDLSVIQEEDEEDIIERRERSASIAIPLEPFPYQLTLPNLNNNNNNNNSNPKETRTLSPPYLTTETIVECSNILDHIFFIFHNDAIKNMCYNSLVALHKYCIINNVFDALLSITATMISFNKYFQKRMFYSGGANNNNNNNSNEMDQNDSIGSISSSQQQQQQSIPPPPSLQPQSQQQIQQQPPPPM